MSAAIQMEFQGRNIPTDVAVEILARLPIKSLLRFRGVSKPWRELLTENHHFTQLHLLQSLKTTTPSPAGIILVRMHKPQFSDFYFAPDCESFHKAKRLQIPFLPSSSSNCPNYRVIGVCNGLICLTDHSSLYLWNPITNVYTTTGSFPPIPPIFSLKALHNEIVYGFGFDRIHNDYKVIRIVSTREDSHYVVHTIGKPGWRTLDAQSYYIPYGDPNEYSTIVNGAIFWIGAEPGSKQENLIVSFDLTSETFNIIPQPSPTYTNFPDHVRVGEFNGSLCVFNLRRIHGVDIWIQDSNGLWMKTFIINKSMVKGTVNSMLPLNGGSNEGVVIKQCFQLFYLFSPTNNSMRKLPKFKFETSSAYTLTGTLISPKDLEKNKLKRTRDEIEDAEAV